MRLQFIFKGLGHALLVPFYRQMQSRSSAIGPELKMALCWWLQTLDYGMCEVECQMAAGN